MGLKTQIMGVLNITPDSFSDGGMFLDKPQALDRACEMAREGADIIDIGGESTRPGSVAVSIDEELKRVIPVIEALASRLNIQISIDTNKPDVARQAIKAGASMINDVMGTPLDREMAKVASESDAWLVIMHIKGKPQTMQNEPVYKDLIGEIMTDLRSSIALAQECGVDSEKIIIDPGIGFGKTVLHNVEIIKRLKEFKELTKPILIGPSRKSFIGALLGIDKPSERLMGTAAACAAAIINGADIIRVHDVKEMAQVAKIVDKIFKA